MPGTLILTKVFKGMLEVLSTAFQPMFAD